MEKETETETETKGEAKIKMETNWNGDSNPPAQCLTNKSNIYRITNFIDFSGY